MSSWLPPSPGLLPLFLLVDAALSWYNTATCFFAPKMVDQLYNGPNAASELTGLSKRTFGSWTFLSGCVRFYAVYNIDVPQVYALAFCTFIAASVHFLTELLLFRTIKVGTAFWFSFTIDIGGLVWMLYQWDAYVGHG